MLKPARRKCAHCREWFHPAREGQVVCSFECASAIGKNGSKSPGSSEGQSGEAPARIREGGAPASPRQA